MQSYIIIAVLIVIPFSVAWLASSSNEEPKGFVVGLLLNCVILMFAFIATDRPTGNYSPAIHNFITETSEFSATIHIKTENGRIENSIRITDAAQLDSFRKGLFEIRRAERKNWWADSYYSGPELIMTKPNSGEEKSVEKL
jgi:hypothetical protein